MVLYDCFQGEEKEFKANIIIVFGYSGPFSNKNYTHTRSVQPFQYNCTIAACDKWIHLLQASIALKRLIRTALFFGARTTVGLCYNVLNRNSVISKRAYPSGIQRDMPFWRYPNFHLIHCGISRSLELCLKLKL